MIPPRCGFAAPPQAGPSPDMDGPVGHPCLARGASSESARPARPASGPAKPDPRRLLDAAKQRIDDLERSFRHIASTRMAGVPVLHAALQVRAVGFAPLPDEPGWLCGVLVTPWFMNLLRLPLEPLADPPRAAAAGCLDVGRDAPRELGGQALHFVGAHEDRLGHYEQCSLYSPMFHFADQAAAVATAAEVMKLLRNPPAAPAPSDATPARLAPPAPAPQAAAVNPSEADEPRPARRGFLFGRGAPAPSPR